MAKLACQALVLTHSNTFFVLLAANPAVNNLDAARVLTIATSFGFTIFVLVYIAAAFSGELKFTNLQSCLILPFSVCTLACVCLFLPVSACIFVRVLFVASTTKHTIL